MNSLQIYLAGYLYDENGSCVNKSALYTAYTDGINTC